MRLFIRLLNGEPVNHPIVENNMRSAFPDVDLDNLPADFADFIKVPQPLPDEMPVGPYQEAVTNYVLASDGKSYQDQWSVRNLTAEEKAEKIAYYKQYPPSNVFVFNEETCAWDNPIPMPADKGVWEWDNKNNVWVNLFPIPIASVDFT